MKRVCDRRARASGAFTLVELLVVMGIIGLLVSLLLPAVNRAVIAARVAATNSTIKALGVGLEAFSADWGVYPPSDKTHDDKLQGADNLGWGYELMAYALMGPSAKGWGKPQGDRSPFGGTATQTYGPYFEQERGSSTVYVRDGFASYGTGGYVLYYRFEPTESSGVGGLFGNYDYSDNPTGDLDKGFQDQNHFLLIARYRSPAGFRWQREDYLLISPGADRLYGHVQDTDPPTAATAYDVSTAAYDDITNFQ